MAGAIYFGQAYFAQGYPLSVASGTGYLATGTDSAYATIGSADAAYATATSSDSAYATVTGADSHP